MNRNAEIHNELIAMESRLAYMPWVLPYAVPEGYFAALAEALKAGVHFSEAEDPHLSGLTKGNAFEIPRGYFSTLVDGLKKAAMNEVSLEKGVQTPYVAPGGYFESLPQTLVTAAKEQENISGETARIIPLRPRWKIRLTRMAAAAILLLGIGYGSYHYMQAPASELHVTKQLASLDAEAIGTYVDQHVDEFDAETLEAALVSSSTSLPATISTLKESEIEDYLMELGETTSNTQNTTL